MKTGEIINNVAKYRGLNLHQIANLADVPYNTLYAIVKRNSTRVEGETLQKIADALDVSVDYLIGQYHLKGILDYRVAEIRDRIFEGISSSELTNEEFCIKLGYPIDEWFKWKEASSISYLDKTSQIAKLLNIPEEELSYELPSVSDARKKLLLRAFDRLNDDGQDEAVKRVSELAELHRYQQSTSDTQDALAYGADSTGKKSPT